MSTDITTEQLSQHTFDSCWIAINGAVYDVTAFAKDHPGGEDLILECAGTDATDQFSSVGHSAGAIKTMTKYAIGKLK